MRNTFLFIATAVMVALIGTLSSCTHANNDRTEDKKPNIVIIYTDDVGYGDISSYGATRVETPNIDQLASNGLLFTNAYAPSATCTPSRYGLLTGEYYWRTPPEWRVGEVEGVSIAPGDAGMIIDTEQPTVASVLQSAGYTTAVVGKWHLGLGPLGGGQDWNDVIKPGPEEIGFDYSFLIPSTGDRVPTVYVENQRVVDLDPDDPIQISFHEPIGHDSTIYNPNVTPAEIVSYPEYPNNDIIDPGTRERVKMHPSFGHDQTIVNGIPRIGYMTGGYSARWKDEDMADEITGKALSFIDENKDDPFFLFFSTHDIHVPRVPHKRFAGQSEIGVYGDVIIQMDWTVGEIMNKLDEFGLTDNTLVIFSSDNGPVLDDGYHDGTVEDTEGHDPAGSLRGGKYSAYEAGTKVPFIVHWPGEVKPGVTDALFSQIDILESLATFVEYGNPEPLTYDSHDHLAALLGNDQTGRDFIIQQNMNGTLSIIKDNWKYIEPADGPRLNPYTRPRMELGNEPNPQLYNLSEDISESNNVAEEYSEITERLAMLLEKVRDKAL